MRVSSSLAIFCSFFFRFGPYGGPISSPFSQAGGELPSSPPCWSRKPLYFFTSGVLHRWQRDDKSVPTSVGATESPHGSSHTIRTGPGYSATTESAVRSVIPSTVACATSNRSKGSLWIGGRLSTATTWSLRIGKSVYPLSSSPRRSSRGSAWKSLRPSPRLIATSHTLAALNRSSFAELSINLLAVAESRFGFPAAHSRRWVSSRSFIFRS